MEKRKFGRTHLQVSELSLNATKFGWLTDESSSFAHLDAYHAGGGNFIQTLGFSPNSATAELLESSSEGIVGRWREDRKINRDTLVLGSRINFFRPVHGGSIAFANAIREACERSLRQLRTSHLDLLICDWEDHLLPVEDFLEAVDRLVRAGLVRYTVAGGFPPWRVVDSLHRSSTRDHIRFEAMQDEYSLLSRSRFEPETLVLCREHRLGFLARSPLAGGFLAQRLSATQDLDRNWQNERFGSHTGDAVRKALATVANRRRSTPAQIALAWVLRNPQVTSAAISAPGPLELRELMHAADFVLTAEEIGSLANVTTVQDHLRELRHA